MKKAIGTAALLTLAAAPVAAQAPTLQPPIDCTLGDDCYIQQYVDHDPSKGAKDYRCAPLSYNRHKGTDFALRTVGQMRVGVDVLAAAPGVVSGYRDGMVDRFYSQDNAAEVDGRECGNGVVVDHGGGWVTQYCHLKKGSVAVKKGQQVDNSTVLGQVGMSGRSQFPHVHISVRKDGKYVDPFDPDGNITCGAPDPATLWADPIAYQPGAILYAGFHDGVPAFDDVKSGRAAKTTLPKDAPALVIFGYAFGTQKGDQMHLILNGPNGVMVDQKVDIDKQQAQMFRAVGKRLTTGGWAQGRYSGSATLLRGGKAISTGSAQVTIK